MLVIKYGTYVSQRLNNEYTLQENRALIFCLQKYNFFFILRTFHEYFFYFFTKKHKNRKRNERDPPYSLLEGGLSDLQSVIVFCVVFYANRKNNGKH